jgi:XRE family transcriptional regulator, regulator of sulfur utilization
MSELSILIGARIKELRKIKKISQMKLAEYCDLNRTFISDVELGKKNASIESIEKITEVLDISFEEFFNFSNVSFHGDNKIINEIVKKLKMRNERDQKFFLELLKDLLEWKRYCK